MRATTSKTYWINAKEDIVFPKESLLDTALISQFSNLCTTVIHEGCEDPNVDMVTIHLKWPQHTKNFKKENDQAFLLEGYCYALILWGMDKGYFNGFESVAQMSQILDEKEEQAEGEEKQVLRKVNQLLFYLERILSTEMYDINEHKFLQ